MGIMERVMSKPINVESNAHNIVSRFTAEEYELLFTLIKNSTFKGEHLELVYNLTLKLQEEYIQLKSKV